MIIYDEQRKWCQNPFNASQTCVKLLPFPGFPINPGLITSQSNSTHFGSEASPVFTCTSDTLVHRTQ